MSRQGEKAEPTDLCKCGHEARQHYLRKGAYCECGWCTCKDFERKEEKP